MLTRKDAVEKVNRQIEVALTRWGDPLGRVQRTNSATGAGGTRIRQLMEASGRAGTIRALSIEGSAAFVYLCFPSRGKPFAQGLGDSSELAIMDAFLQCSERIGLLAPL